MDQFEQEEFWKSLNRLYLATEKLHSGAEKLVLATEKLRETAVAHESRLDKLEVVQEWLAAREREREKRERGE